MTRVIVVDLLAREHGKRIVTVDVIGAGPRALAGLLAGLGYRVDLVPLETVLEEPRRLADYDALFASAMSSDKPAAAMLASLWRKYGGGVAVLGGPISVEPLEGLRLGYDVVVFGEAEATLPDAHLHILRGDVEGLLDKRGFAFRLRNREVFTGRPGFAPKEKLNYMHYTRLENYPIFWAARVYVEAVRGCSNWRRPRGPLPDGRSCINCDLCTHAPLRARLYCPAFIPPGCGYCSVPALYGPARSRALNVIVDEVRELVKRGVTRVVLSAPDILDYGRDELVEPEPLTDPCKPPVNTDALRELFERLFEAIPEFETREAVLMIENVKACLVDERIARLLGEYLRGTPVHIGVETGSDRHMWLLGRPITSEDARRAVKLLREAGLQPYVYFIYGLPWETRETIGDTLRLMEELHRLGAVKVTAYRFRPLPGTAFESFEPPKPGSPSYAILEKAVELNRLEKERWVGRVLRGAVAGWHPVRRMLVIYPYPHGPVILARGPRSLVGWLVRVLITSVESDRMLRGMIVSRVRRLAPARMGLRARKRTHKQR